MRKVFFAVLSVLFAVLIVLLFPQVLINNRTLPFILHEFVDPGLTWSQAAIKVRSPSILKKEFTFALRKVCLESDQVRGCIDNLSSTVSLKLGKPFIEQIEISDFQIKGQELEIAVGGGKSSQSKTSSLGVLSRVLVLNGDLKLTQMTLRGLGLKDEPIRVDLSVHLNKGTAHVACKASTSLIKLRAAGRIDGEQISGEITLKEKPNEVWVSLRAKKNEGNYQYSLNSNFQTAAARGTVETSGLIRGSSLKGRVSSRVRYQGLQFAVRRECEYSKQAGRYRVSCPVRVIRGDFDRPLIADFSVDLRQDKNLFSGSAELNVLSFSYYTAGIAGRLRADFANAPLSAGLVENMQLTSDTEIAVARFERLVDFLRPTKYAIPAPFNSLKGACRVTVKGRLLPEKERLPWTFQLDLSDSDQQFKIKANGSVGLTRAFTPDVLGDVQLTDVLLHLPPISLEAPPPTMPDRRFRHRSSHKIRKALPMSFSVRVSTPAKPVRLISNLAKNPIPIWVSLEASNVSPTKGWVAVREFPLELFRRDAKVKYINLALDRKTLDGLIEVRYVDYLVMISITGNVEKPLVKFESIPPLPPEDVVSVLLFGKPMGELSPDQTQSVGSMESALADRALTLGSLYILASTPIESVGYNAEKREFSAKLKLQEGMSLVVGSDTESISEIGINKRLSRSWSVHTYLNHPAEETNRSATAFLEWFKKY